MARRNDRKTADEEGALRDLLRPIRGDLGRATVQSILSALVWPVQAAFAAQTLAGMPTSSPVLWTGVAGFVLFGALRSAFAY